MYNQQHKKKTLLVAFNFCLTKIPRPKKDVGLHPPASIKNKEDAQKIKLKTS